jgi:hypothetical protein
MNIDLTPIWYQEVNLLGSLAHGVETWPPDTNKQRSTFSIAHELIEQGQLHPEQLITHHFALTDYRHALMTAADKAHNRAIKVVFDYALLPASTVPNVRASARQHRQAITEVVEDRQSREAQEVEQTIVALPADTENAPTTTNGATHAPQRAEGPFPLQGQPPGRSRRKNTKSSNTSE